MFAHNSECLRSLYFFTVLTFRRRAPTCPRHETCARECCFEIDHNSAQVIQDSVFGLRKRENFFFSLCGCWFSVAFIILLVFFSILVNLFTEYYRCVGASLHWQFGPEVISGGRGLRCAAAVFSTFAGFELARPQPLNLNAQRQPSELSTKICFLLKYLMNGRLIVVIREVERIRFRELINIQFYYYITTHYVHKMWLWPLGSRFRLSLNPDTHPGFRRSTNPENGIVRAVRRGWWICMSVD